MHCACDMDCLDGLLDANSSIAQAYELSVLTGTQVLLLVVSETGLVYTFTTPKLQPLVTKPEGKNLIQVSCVAIQIVTWLLTLCLQACLNAPEPAPGNENGIDGESNVDSPEDVNHAQIPAPQASMPRGGGGQMPQQHYMTPEQQQQMAYQQYMHTQQQGVGGQYPMPPQGLPHQPKLEEHMLR